MNATNFAIWIGFTASNTEVGVVAQRAIDFKVDTDASQIIELLRYGNCLFD